MRKQSRTSAIVWSFTWEYRCQIVGSGARDLESYFWVVKHRECKCKWLTLETVSAQFKAWKHKFMYQVLRYMYLPMSVKAKMQVHIPLHYPGPTNRRIQSWILSLFGCPLKVLNQVQSVLLQLQTKSLRRDQSRGGNSNASKMDRTWFMKLSSNYKINCALCKY